MRRWLLPVGALLGLTLIAGCASDDGNKAPEGNTGSTASGLANKDLSAKTTNELVLTATTEYKTYAAGQVDDTVRLTKVFTDAVRAGDLAAAQAAYAPSREPWERIEPIAGLVEEIDGKVDARVDDFASVDDPAFTGWHRLEYLLFEKGTTEGGAPFADQLDADLNTLKTQFGPLEIPPVAVPVGASELIEEVSQGKITGEEDRYSKTDLWDFDANLQGSKAAIEKLGPALQKSNPELLAKIEAGFADLDKTLAPLREGNGWKLFCLEGDQYPSPRCTSRHRQPGHDRHAEGPARRAVGEPGAGGGSPGTEVTGLSRRRFVAGALGAGAAIGVGTVVTGCTASTGEAAAEAPRFVPFDGVHQAGIAALPIPTRGLMAVLLRAVPRPRPPRHPVRLPHRRDPRAHGGPSARGARSRVPARRLRDPRRRPAT